MNEESLRDLAVMLSVEVAFAFGGVEMNGW